MDGWMDGGEGDGVAVAAAGSQIGGNCRLEGMVVVAACTRLEPPVW